MTTLKEKLRNDMATAMREGAKERRDVLRMLLAAVKQEEVDSQKELDDSRVQAVLARQAKQRKESIADAERANRPEMAASEESELLIIEAYLPKQLAEDEIRAAAKEVIDDLGASGMQDMGQVMGKLMPVLKDQADGRLVSQVVREMLQG